MWGRPSSALQSSSSRQGRGERFAQRRWLQRRRVFVAFCILLAVLSGVLVWGLWQSSVRISRVQIFGPPSLGSFGGASANQALAEIAASAMQGSYLGIIPRDSFFFFPESAMRAGILAAHPDIAAVSLFRNGLTGLSIQIHERVAIARWCGSTSSPQAVAPTAGADEYCYLFDANGYVFSAADVASTTPVNNFTLYAPLDSARGGPPAVSEVEPLRATVVRNAQLPSAFDFARQLATLGSPVAKIILRDDEVDDILTNGTRITYVLGREQDAFTALVSASANLDLADGSIEYVDLRFDGKVYLKKK
ncbi:hypothetical protein A3C94_02440 [Candidatus Kaiserbacteria bacterium RIFCSPHIGHO2_02_FULL_55_17]|uniref:POTRA domain-containing protein n=1 Tax=Candidatus Kaiserbacteria bacterium RIFCSPHIGHO2_02_FULL_55_17 TaxID=1798496 RepID=A0A1F6DSQ4_9BACT|nr:MAG: hypothetical protein A3C94_02440 [Candidatus Kaiserbacteria bacterium RIFCSPHIGHO2_02_FULL_55_17]